MRRGCWVAMSIERLFLLRCSYNGSSLNQWQWRQWPPEIIFFWDFLNLGRWVLWRRDVPGSWDSTAHSPGINIKLFSWSSFLTKTIWYDKISKRKACKAIVLFFILQKILQLFFRNLSLSPLNETWHRTAHQTYCF